MLSVSTSGHAQDSPVEHVDSLKLSALEKDASLVFTNSLSRDSAVSKPSRQTVPKFSQLSDSQSVRIRDSGFMELHLDLWNSI